MPEKRNHQRACGMVHSFILSFAKGGFTFKFLRRVRGQAAFKTSDKKLPLRDYTYGVFIKSVLRNDVALD